MANIKVSQLAALTPPAAADVLPIVDISANATKKTTVGEIVGIVNGDVDVANDGTATISELPVSKLQDGDARQLLQTDAAGTGVEWTSNVDVSGTLDVTGTTTLDAALNVAGLASLDGGIDVDGAFTVADTSGNIATSGTLGVTGQSTLASAAVSDLTSGRVVLAGTSGELEDSAGLTFNGTQLDVGGDVVIAGDLTVEGASTILETETVKVEDKNIELGVVALPTDVTADGGGITLKGTTDKTLNWVDATDSWTSSENVDLASGKSYRINGTEVLSATALGSAVQISSANIPSGTIVDDDINAAAEIAVSKLADGSARQLLQTDAAGTGVEWTSNVDVPGTLDVTSAATFDSSVAVTGALTKSGSNVVTVGDTGTITSTMLLDGTIVNADVNASAAIVGTKISPDFGSQNVATTGTATAAALIPSGSSVPTNGVYLPSANNVAISTNSTERVRIKSDGVTSFGQGATGPGSGVAGTLINAGDGGILITNNTDPFLRCYTLSGGFPDALQIANNGNVTNANNSYGAISDIKLKENIVDASSQWNDLKAFQVRNYNLKEGQTHTQIGLIAQEVELVSPGLVSESPDRDEDGNDLGTVTKSVNYSVLYMKAVKALQEAMERIEALEADVAQLKGA
jgi:hypothetical protein